MQDVSAIRAKKDPFVITQPDGSKLTIRMNGDEFHKFRSTVDGIVVKKDIKGFYTYARTDANGNIVAGKVIAKDKNKRTADDLNYISSISTEAVKSATTKLARAKAAEKQQIGNKIQRAFPMSGSPKSLVILVNFADKSFSIPNANTAYHDLLNKVNYSANGATGSARDYFMASSYGQFSPDFDVVGPFTLPGTMASYGANDSKGQDVDPAGLIVDACTAADPTVDFSQYDTDGDIYGLIDNVFVYYAGYNEAEDNQATNINVNTIWPHRWAVYTSEDDANDYSYDGTIASVTFDGKRLYDYACTSELKGYNGSDMCGIGTFAHEFGHVIGLPDYYDTDQNQYNTLDEWSIMDYGGYSNEGRTPPAYSAYDRFFLGWLAPQQVSTPTDLTLLPLSQGTTVPANTNQQSYLLSATTHNLVGNNPTPKEFFMVEYRKQTGWDSYLPGEGMLIWHIDYDQVAWDNNGPNNFTGTTQAATDHMRVYLQPLSGSTTTPGDAFTSGSFTPTTWSGTNINRAITSINKTSNNVTFKLMGGTVGPNISTAGVLKSFKTDINANSANQNIVISGTTLSAAINISLANNDNFEIKLSTESVWSKSVIINPISGSVQAVLNVRFSPTTVGTKTNSIILTSTGATDLTLELSGLAVDPNAAVLTPGLIDSELTFATTNIQSTKTKTLNIKTTDLNADLTVSITGTNASYFSVSKSSIAKNSANGTEGKNLIVNYSPSAVGSHSAVLTISGGGLNPAKVINLQGVGK
jgi:M6 family metalloprotease-like protein